MRRTLVFALVLSFTLFGFISTATAQRVIPKAEITPDPLEFSDTRAGTTSDTETLTVTAADGILPLYIFSVTLADSDHFTVVSDGCSNAFLFEEESCDVHVSFSPAGSGHYVTSTTVLSLSREIVDTSVVEGQGVSPRAVLSASAIAYGDQTINKSSHPHEVTLTNAGNMALAITSIETDAPFAVTDDCGDTLAVDATCTLLATFTPTATGAVTGTVTITDDASDSPQTIALTGTGIEQGHPDPSFSRHAVAFAGQTVGTTSTAEEVTLANTGTAALTIDSIVASGNFAVADDCGATLAVDATCTLSITFTPSAVGTFSGTVTITDNATDSPQTIALTGTGTSSGSPSVSLSATNIDFGNVEKGSTSDVQTVTLTNSGSENLAVSSVTLAGESNSSGFSHTDSCHGESIAPGGTCTIALTFAPPAEGTYDSVLEVTDDAADSPQQILLSGTGTQGGGGGGSGGGCALVSSAGANPSALAMLLMAMGILAYRRKKY